MILCVTYCSVTMDEVDSLVLRTPIMNSTDLDADRCAQMLALPVNTAAPIHMEALDVKPELLDLSESRPREARSGHQQATKSCQTEITICDEFWTVCISRYHGHYLGLLVFCRVLVEMLIRIRMV